MLRTSEKLKNRLGTELRFIREWIREPGAVGAIAPTGKAAARAMASHAPLDSDLPVLELGPGTGAITAAILERGIPAERLVSVEYSKEFYGYLKTRFPGVNFINGDALDLATTLADTPWRRFSAVICAVPLLNLPKPTRTRIIADCLSLVESGAPFVQISYGPRPPAPVAKGQYVVDSSDWVMKNVPPARVFVYRRQEFL